MRVTARLLAGACYVGAILGVAAPDAYCSEPDSSVVVRSLTPAAGSRAKATTIIRAEVAYSIQAFEPKTAQYVLTPMFTSTEQSVSFNHLNRFLDAKRLKTASGIARIKYPIAKEWADPKLHRPIKFVFRILRVTGKTAVPIADSEIITYEADDGA